MPAYGECHSTEIDAPPQACFDALVDFETLPAWQRAVREVRVLERDEAGRGSVVEYVVDARVKSVRYRLRQIYDEPCTMACEYLDGDFRDFSGEWRFEAMAGCRTRVELELSIDPGRLIPKPLRAAIADAVMRRSLRDLKCHVEATRLT